MRNHFGNKDNGVGWRWERNGIEKNDDSKKCLLPDGKIGRTRTSEEFASDVISLHPMAHSQSPSLL